MNTEIEMVNLFMRSLMNNSVDDETRKAVYLTLIIGLKDWGMEDFEPLMGEDDAFDEACEEADPMDTPVDWA